METYVTFYSWLCRTAGLIVLQMFWHMRLISDFFAKKKSIDQEDQFRDQLKPLPITLKPLQKDQKKVRHIRSMSDVVSSQPCHNHKTPRRHSHVYEGGKPRRRARKDYSDSSNSGEERWRASIIEENLVSRCMDVENMRYL